MRAKSIITFGLMASALAISGNALALGLGRLTVDSALGQPLSARIELTSASRDEVEQLSAKVADPSLYRSNNLTYQGVLARTRISVEYVGGNPVLKITSASPVNEPFLDLMVELNWPAGRVVREYTFLLDPPGLATPAVAEPIAPARTGPARAAQAPRAPAAAATTDGGGTRATGGRIGTAVAESTPAAPPGRDQLKVSRDVAGKGTGGAEEQVARDKQLRDAQARITDLEKTVRDLQRAIEI